MSRLADCEAKIYELEAKILHLETELECKEQAHVLELKTVRDQLTAIIHLYKLD